MSKIKYLKKGASLALSYGAFVKDPETGIRSPANMTDWSVQVKVRAEIEGDDIIAAFALTSLNSDLTRRLGMLDTSSLDPGIYYVMARIFKSSTGEQTEPHLKIRVQKSGF